VSAGPGSGDNWIRYYEDPQAPLNVDAFDAEQIIDVSKQCGVTTDGSLLAISAADDVGSRDVGLVSNGYGVKTKNNCSSAQGRVGLGQSITFELGSSFAENIEMVLGEVDVEGKFGADLGYAATLGEEVFSGTVELPNTTDNGPDSGGNDNNIVVIAPEMNFRSITFEAAGDDKAEVAVEGGGDAILAGEADSLRTALGVNQSLFELVSLREFDAGDLDCGDVVGPTAPDEEGPAERIILGRGDNLKSDPCNQVAYTFRIETESVLFDANIEDQENANFLIRIDWDPDIVAVDPANPPDRQINYFPFVDPDDYEDTLACLALLDEGSAEDGDIISEDPDPDDVYLHPTGPTPSGKFDGEIVPWCVAGEKLVLLEAEVLGQPGKWQQVQWYDGAGDPRWR
jgi:hypothetical protein